MALSKHERQIAAITRVIRQGKAKNPDKAKAKIEELKRKKAWNDYLAK